MKVSVIITTYNRPSSLRLSLLSFARQDRLPDEIVIADDGSGPETAELVTRLKQEMPCPVHHAWQEDLGWRVAASRNNGFRASSGEYVIFVDGDVVAAEGFVSAHLKQARSSAFLLGNAYTLSPEISEALVKGEIQIAGLCRIPRPEQEARLARVHRKNVRHALLRRFRLCSPIKPRLVGLHFSLHRQDYEKVNGCDEDYVGWGQEDDDLGRRLVLAGVRPRSVVPYATAYHIHHPRGARRLWCDGPNAHRLMQREVPFFCPNGLVKG